MFAPPSAELAARVLSSVPGLPQRVPDCERRLTIGELRCFLGPASNLVITSGASWRVVVGAAGDERLLALVSALQEQSDALVFDEGVVPLPPAALAGLGLRRVVRERFLQNLLALRDESLPDAQGVSYVPLTESLVGPARRLFGRTHALSIEGVYTTLPLLPSAQECERAFVRDLGKGLVAPSAIAAVFEGRVVGEVTCCIPDGEPHPVLMTLAVDPSVRGRGLSRGLVRRTQKALKDAGHTHMVFFTTDRNLPVHKLFTPDEIVESSAVPAWFGMRDLETGLWPRPAR